MNSASFYGLPQEEQVRRLGSLAGAVLPRWSLTGAEVRPLAYRENMTFEVDAGAGGRYALRVHQAGYRTDAQIQSELDYMEYLNGQGVPTPQVVRASDGSSFVVAEHSDIAEPRQCDLFEWIDGKPLRNSGEPPDMAVGEAAKLYARVGRQAAALYSATEAWTRPDGFVRPVWDAEGIFGVSANLGDFRKSVQLSDAQRTFLGELAARLTADLDAFGKTSDRWGLSQGDFLSENVMVTSDGLRLVDFDDAGEGWYLFDIATALFDLSGSDYFEPCLEGYVAGFRELRELPEHHLKMLPAFILARVMSYLGHAVTRSHLEQSEWLQPVFTAMLEEHGTAYLNS
jgi:Ser/Thr protein kinase RdoA (MazF antagonist)